MSENLPEQKKEWVFINETAKILGVSTRTINRYILDKTIPMSAIQKILINGKIRKRISLLFINELKTSKESKTQKEKEDSMRHVSKTKDGLSLWTSHNLSVISNSFKEQIKILQLNTEQLTEKLLKSETKISRLRSKNVFLLTLFFIFLPTFFISMAGCYWQYIKYNTAVLKFKEEENNIINICNLKTEALKKEKDDLIVSFNNNLKSLTQQVNQNRQYSIDEKLDTIKIEEFSGLVQD